MLLPTIIQFINCLPKKEMERVDRLWIVTGKVLPSARDQSPRIKHLVYYPKNSKIYHLGDGKRHRNLSLKW